MSSPVLRFSLALILLGMGWPAWASPLPSKAEASAALQRMEKAFKGKPADSDVIFVIAQANRLTGRKFEPELDPAVIAQKEGSALRRLQYGLWSMRHEPLPRVPQVALKPEAFALSPLVRPPEPDRHFSSEKVMTAALECRPGATVKGIAAEPGVGYVSAHQLLGLMLATRRGCITQQQFETGVIPYVRRVYSEMLRDLTQASDLQVERIAFLVLAGRQDLVPGEYLKGLLAWQSPDGLWRFGVPPKHTSSLVYLALSPALVQPAAAKGSQAAKPVLPLRP